MNRAWIPAGALASVSVAGLIALGPLTDSLHTPRVVPVRRDGVRCRHAEEQCRWRSASRRASVGNTTHAALNAGRAGGRRRTATSVRSRRRSRSQRPQTSRVTAPSTPAPSAPATPVKKKPPSAQRRSAAPAGRTVTSASRQAATRTGRRVVASSSARPPATPPETCRRPGRVGKIRALGAIAQLGERLDRTQEVSGSSPLSSTPAIPLSIRDPDEEQRALRGALCASKSCARGADTNTQGRGRTLQE